MAAVRRLHQRDGGQQRDGRLANADRVKRRAIFVLTESDADLDQIVDVIVKVEGTCRQRQLTRIDPIGDVDIVERQERLDGSAQQGGVVTRQRRNDQQLGLGRRRGAVELALEMKQTAEWPPPHDAFGYRNAFACHERAGQAERRLAVAARQPFEQFEGCDDILAEMRVGEQIGGVLQPKLGHVGHSSRRRQRKMGNLVKFISERRHCQLFRRRPGQRSQAKLFVPFA